MAEKIREYDTVSRTTYIHKREFDKKGKLVKESWQRDKGGKIEELVDAVHISAHQYNILKPDLKNKLPIELMKIAKKENYIWDKGLIFFIKEDYTMWHSSFVKNIEPPYERKKLGVEKPKLKEEPKIEKPELKLKPVEEKSEELKPAKIPEIVEIDKIIEEGPSSGGLLKDEEDKISPGKGLAIDEELSLQNEPLIDDLEGSSLGNIDLDE